MDAVQARPPMLRRILKAAVSVLLTALLAAVFYVAVILGEPQEIEQIVQPLPDQPLLQAIPAINISGEGQLPMVLNAFPAPVMHPLSGSGLTFVSGACYDAAFEEGFGRIVSLRYVNEAGREMTVESIYPARALTLMGKKDYHLAGVAGQSLAGMKSVRMENGESIRLHAQAEDAIYVVTVPAMESAELLTFTRSLQLFEGE